MAKLILSIPEDLHLRMKHHSEIQWDEILRKAIAERVETLELLDKLTSRSKLTSVDIEEIAHKINQEVFEDLRKR